MVIKILLTIQKMPYATLIELIKLYKIIKLADANT